MKVKTILITANSYYFLHHFHKELIERLLSQYKIIIAVPNGAENKHIDNTQYEDVYIARKSVNPFKEVLTVLSYLRIIIKTKPDLIITFTIKPIIYAGAVARILHIPTLHTFTGMGTAFINRTILKTLVRWILHVAISRQAHIFTLNTQDFAELRKILPNRNIEKIGGAGVDLTKFEFRPKSGDTYTFAYIGRIIKDKGVVDYIHACKKLRKKVSNINCLLVGPLDPGNRSGITEHELKELIKDGSVTYIGESDEIPRLLNSIDILVLPSYREGLPTIILEAMASGTLVITTDVPGCNDLIYNLENGLIAKCKNPNDLMRQMLYAIKLDTRKYKDMINKARQDVEKNYTLNKINNEYKKIISTLLEKSS